MMNECSEELWENFSDELSAFLDGFGLAENMSPDTADKIHKAAVKIYQDELRRDEILHQASLRFLMTA